MKTLTLIIALLVCLPASAEETVCKNVSYGDTCYGICPEGYYSSNGECECHKINHKGKSKRQEYIDKCDDLIMLMEKCMKDVSCKDAWLQLDAQIATTYCTRALLEDK